MVITEAVRMDDSTMNNHRPITSRANKAPVYTKDKRDKFTQRENKKWVRLATVVGYLISVCIPAIALTVYYVGFWDPQYKTKFQVNDSAGPIRPEVIITTLITDPPSTGKREIRSEEVVLKCPECECNKNDENSEGSKIGLNSLLNGRYFTLSPPTEDPSSPYEYQSNEETITSKQNSAKKPREKSTSDV